MKRSNYLLAICAGLLALTACTQPDPCCRIQYEYEILDSCEQGQGDIGPSDALEMAIADLQSRDPNWEVVSIAAAGKAAPPVSREVDINEFINVQPAINADCLFAVLRRPRSN